MVGLQWADIDLKARRLHLRQAQAEEELSSVKTQNSDRIIIDKQTAAELKAWRKRTRLRLAGCEAHRLVMRLAFQAWPSIISIRSPRPAGQAPPCHS
jgi:integrase